MVARPDTRIDASLAEFEGPQVPHSGKSGENVCPRNRTIRYRAFGKRITLSGGIPARLDPGFQNRTLDAGLNLYDYRNRTFDPCTGRFIQRDPVTGGDTLYNPYVFPGNNPVGNVDPMGLGDGTEPPWWARIVMALDPTEVVETEKEEQNWLTYMILMGGRNTLSEQMTTMVTKMAMSSSGMTGRQIDAVLASSAEETRKQIVVTYGNSALRRNTPAWFQKYVGGSGQVGRGLSAYPRLFIRGGHGLVDRKIADENLVAMGKLKEGLGNLWRDPVGTTVEHYREWEYNVALLESRGYHLESGALAGGETYRTGMIVGGTYFAGQGVYQAATSLKPFTFSLPGASSAAPSLSGMSGGAGVLAPAAQGGGQLVLVLPTEGGSALAQGLAAMAGTGPSDLPGLDITGKVHGRLPRRPDFSKYSRDQLEQLLRELKKSVRERIRKNAELGRHKPHGQRQAAEQQLMKQLEKYLKDTRPPGRPDPQADG